MILLFASALILLAIYWTIKFLFKLGLPHGATHIAQVVLVHAAIYGVGLAVVFAFIFLGVRIDG